MKTYETIMLYGGLEMNPFSLTFGVLPEQFIKRDAIRDQILSCFTSEKPSSHVFILRGVRGSGKTVMLNYLRNEFDKEDNWITINVNPEMDILESIASKLYEKGMMKKYFLKKSFNFSFHGFGFSLEGDEPIKNIETLLEKMVDVIEKQNKRILITLDEISSSKNIRVFTHTFKNFVNENKPLYFLATGLNENVMSLQNEDNLTFIYRAPKIEIAALNLTAIANSYIDVLGLEERVAFKCAKFTEGYASAYQVLGSILYANKKKDIDADVLKEFDQILEDINYGKLWSDLSNNDKRFLYGFKGQRNNKAKDIISISGIAQNSYAKYRDRLLKKGVIVSSTYGFLSLTLPRLFEFIQKQKYIDNLEM